MPTPVEQIKGKLTIVDVVGSYVKLEKAGQNFKGRCPFHNERTPSFFVSPARESFHCFGCGKGGDMFTFVEEIEGLEFKEALRTLAERAGVDISAYQKGVPSGNNGRLRTALEEATLYYQEVLGKSASAKKYLSERGLSDETILAFRIGFAPAGWRNLADHLAKRGIAHEDAERAGLLIKSEKGYYDRFRERIMFPFSDVSGKVLGFSGRILPGASEEATMGKYVNSPETPLFHKSRVFYGMREARSAIREEDALILVEGQLDVCMGAQAGTKNIVGVSGTAFGEEHAALITRMSENLIIVLDGDEAGFRAAARSVRIAHRAGLYVQVVALPAGKDPADIAKEDPKSWLHSIKERKPFVTYCLEVIASHSKDRQARQNEVREYLYPAIADMYNEIEKDAALVEVGEILGVGTEAVRTDFQKWSSTQAAPERAAKPEVQEVAEAYESMAGMPLVAARLWGILYTYKPPGLQDELEKILEREYESIHARQEERREDLMFQTEMYYPTEEGIEQETKVLLKRLQEEVLKHKFQHAMEELRAAEKQGDSARAGALLEICHSISKQLSQLRAI